MINDDEPGPAADSDSDAEDSDTFEGALGRTIGGVVVIFALLVAVGVIAWLIFK